MTIIRAKEHFVAVAPLALLSGLVLAVRERFAAWIFMWFLALAMYLGCKWMCFWRVRRGAEYLSAAAFLLAYSGMDAERFLKQGRRVEPPTPQNCHEVLGKIALGLALQFWAAVEPFPMPPYLRAWAGMAGAILCLHFGVFELLSLAWRSVGRDASSLMRTPLRSESLQEFWGQRWNSAFHELVRDHIFLPLRKRVPGAVALLGVFLISGLVHDLVISVPARGGYGLPTVYFLIQGYALLIERSSVGRRLGLASGVRGRAYAILVPLLPAPLLFHGEFVANVIIPMLNAIGTGVQFMTLDIVTLLKVAALLHVGLMAAGVLMPKAVGLREHLATLPRFIRQLFWVYYFFIGLCLVTFSLITFLFAEALASGTAFARMWCAFFVVFWVARWVIGTFIFDLRPYLTGPLRRIGLTMANCVFATLPFIYGAAAMWPGKR